MGYDEGGQLTVAVRREPYSVILLDEIEKAHPDVFNVLLQVLDDGRLTDNKGRTVDFKNTILIMTSNIGSDIIQLYMNKIVEGGDKENLMEECKRDVLTILKKSVRPEFINRIDEIIMFEPLTQEAIYGILDIQLREVKGKLAENGVNISFSKEFVDYLAEKGFDPAYGARPIKRLLQRELVNRLATEMLKGTISKDADINVDFKGGELVIS